MSELIDRKALVEEFEWLKGQQSEWLNEQNTVLKKALWGEESEGEQ